MRLLKTSIATALLTAMTSTPALAHDPVNAKEHTAVKVQKDHYIAIKDSTWVTMTGKITDVDASGFSLDYGDAAIRIDVEDGNYSADKVKVGEFATVTGQLDDDVFESQTIEAATVRIPSSDITFLSSSIDDESSDLYKFASRAPANVSQVTVMGRVVDMEDDSLQLDVGENYLVVDLSKIPGDITASNSDMRVHKGDYVSVQVELDPEAFGTYDFDATAVNKI